jgi:hypothetical protein
MSELLEIVDDNAAPFFAPVSSDVIDGLLGRYQTQREHISQIASIAAGGMGGAINWFIAGNKDRGHIPGVEQLFAEPGAVAALNSRYWSDALALTDVYDCMPQARRDEWNKTISEQKAPEFTEDAVRPTINSLLADRNKFFAERVDGIFRGLSGHHVTNVPEGFSKRMIISYVTDQHGYATTGRCGLINDLRAVIAKFMGRDEPKWNMTGPVVKHARQNSGEWITIDGGALRIRCYKIGTAHLEVHPDMAYRLNQVLAGLYPRAIPAAFRAKPIKKHKEFQMMGRPLPFLVCDVLSGVEPAYTRVEDDRGRVGREPIPNAVRLPYSQCSEAVFEEARRVLVSIGGVLIKGGNWQFDYAPARIIAEIVASGCVPDVKTHQYYPTPASIARIAIDMAAIGPDDTVLEPSAGQGGIADHLPAPHRAVCVEISKLHCDILTAKGFVAVQADFLAWAAGAPKFDRIIMNPPFSEGRALAHLQVAAMLLKPNGRLVAVLPASLKGKDVLPGWALEWSEVYSGEFAGTSVSVVILLAVQP